jgi:hypothetical protein
VVPVTAVRIVIVHVAIVLVAMLSVAMVPVSVFSISIPSSHYYLRSLSRTSRTFSFPDSRDPLEVLGGLSWQRERGGSLGDPPGP